MEQYSTVLHFSLSTILEVMQLNDENFQVKIYPVMEFGGLKVPISAGR